MGLIAGEAQIAESETGLSNSIGALARGFSTTYAIFQQEEEKRAAMMEAYAANAGGIDQMNFMKDPKNKEIVRSFLNKQRDEMARLGGIYEKTKDREVKDKMEAIKFSLVNLNDQIKVFNEDKSEYRTAFDEDQLAAGSTFKADFFTGAYTNNGSFIIAENGDMSFDVKGKNYLYKEEAGKWNPKNNITEEFFRGGYSKAIAAGEAGKYFYEETVNMSIDANLKSTGTDGLWAIVTTDLTGDTRNGKQIPYSFQAQWEGGMLDDKFYKNRKKEEGSDWMFKNENSKELRGLMSTYLTDVTKDGYEIGKKNYKGNDNPKAKTIDLPWAKGIPAATNSKEESQYQAVIALETKQPSVRIENDVWVLNNKGVYELKASYVNGKYTEQSTTDDDNKEIGYVKKTKKELYSLMPLNRFLPPSDYTPPSSQVRTGALTGDPIVYKEGDKANHKDGRPIIYTDGKWIIDTNPDRK